MKTTVTIGGMHCPNCVRRLTQAIQNVPGVTAVKVTLDPPQAELESDATIPVEVLHAAAQAVGDYSIAAGASTLPVAPDTKPSTPEKPASLYPLGLIVGYIAATAALVTHMRGDGTWSSFMLDFMAGFFLVFSFFKLLDLKGFANAYQSYDILAAKSRAYALLYPFLELGLGIAYLVRWNPTFTNAATLALMLVGSIGVLRALLNRQRIRCACLGTALNLPMTTVTLVEDLGMAAMAGAALVFPH